MKRLLISFILLSFVFSSVQAQRKRVPQDYATIQAAINAAVNGDTVLVSEGTYSVNVLLTKKIVLGSLYVLDKDTSHISKTILNGSSPRHADSASVITIDGATDTTTMIVGFTIKGGQGNRRVTPDPLVYRVGTGIDVAGGGATIRKNFITANNVSASTRVGGVVNIWDLADANGISFVVVEDNTISDNALNGTPNVEGGALAIGHSCRIIRNRILRNSAIGTSAGAGAVAQIWNGTILFDGNLMLNNSVSHLGGAIQTGQYYMLTGPTISLVNNIIANNSAGVLGGALWMGGLLCKVISVNNTIIGNTSPSGSGLYVKDTASFKAINTILWNPGTSEITLSTGGTVTAAYSNVRGGLAGTGNINSDPLFVPSDSVYRLTGGSPCIGAGVISASVGGTTLNAPTVDYLGLVRPRPVSSNPDLGAVEHDRASPDPLGGVEELTLGLPTEFSLSQNFPNPFNPATTIRFALPSQSDVQISIYNVLGQKVEELVNERLEAGFKQVTWTASVPSGVYLCRITASTVGGQRYEQTRKMILVR